MTERELLQLAAFPHEWLPVLECGGCKEQVAADVRDGRWTCPRETCRVTNITPKRETA